MIEDQGLKQLENRLRTRDQHQLSAWLFEGYRAQELLSLQQGTHLTVLKDGRMHPEQVVVLPLHEEEAADVLLRVLERHQKCQDAISDTIAGAGTSAVDDPFQWQPVLSIRKEGEQGGIDFRTGGPGEIAPVDRLLPLPPEWKT